jgi:hypothetical protein
MGKQIFISYSSKDANVANKMVAYLESHGCTCWIAPRDIASSEDYTDQINDAIKSSQSLLLIVSEKSICSQWVKKELTTAVSYNKRIIPFKIQDVTLSGGLEFMLINLQWIDASSNMTSHFHEVIDGLGITTTPNTTPSEKTTSNPHRKRFLIIGIAAILCICIALITIIITSSRNNNETILQNNPDSIVIDSASNARDSSVSKDPTVVVPNKKIDSSDKGSKDKKEKREKPSIVVESPIGNSTNQPVGINSDRDSCIQSPQDKNNYDIQKYKKEYSTLAQQLGGAKYNNKIKEYKKRIEEHPDDISLSRQIMDDKETLKSLISKFEKLQEQNPTDTEVKRSIVECKKYLKELENIKTK